MPFLYKLERLSLASLFTLVKYLQVRPELTQVNLLSGAPLYGRLLALPANIKLSWKGLTGTNAHAYNEKA